MSTTQDLLTIAQAAEELGLTPSGIRNAVMYTNITPVRIDGRTKMIPRAEVERYRAEHLGQRGKRMLPDEALTEQQRKQRAYQRAYYQRRKAARKQQPAKSAEE